MNLLAVICDLKQHYLAVEQRRLMLKLWSHVPIFVQGFDIMPRPTVTTWRDKPAKFVLRERLWSLGRIEDAWYARRAITGRPKKEQKTRKHVVVLP